MIRPMIHRTAAASAALLLAAASPAFAQYEGPGVAPTPTSVAEILRRPVDDQRVTLVGTITRKIGDERYVFTDGTGDIAVEIDDDDLPSQAFGPQDRVEIHGEVDVERDRPLEIDVERIRLF